MKKSDRITKIVKKFRSDKESIREEASKELMMIIKEGLSLEENLQALKAAAQSFPVRRYDFQDSSSELIYAVTRNPRIEYIPIVLEIFPILGPKARSAALSLMATFKEREAAIAYMEIVRKYAMSDGLPELITWPLTMPLRHLDVFFPELLNYTSNPKLAQQIFEFCLNACAEKALNINILTNYVTSILSRYVPLRDSLMPKQQSGGIAWMWEYDYLSLREDCGVLLDLMGYVKLPEIVAELQKALLLKDTKLKGFAVVSLLRQGIEVDSLTSLNVASDPVIRNFFYNELQTLGKLSNYPNEFRTQEAFAESDMVGWLTFGTELERAPDEIELMKTVSIDTKTEDGVLDYFIFRFRTFEPHWAAKDGWMAGISGPFLRKETPSTKSYGDTFSSFEKWDSKTPEEHLGDIRERLSQWYESQINRRKSEGK